MPEALEGALEGFGAALVARDAARLGRWLGPELVAAGSPAERLAGVGPETHRVVAFAKIGDKRMVKMRIEGVRRAGLSGAVTVLMRWAPTADGWQAEAVDVVGLDPLPPV
jgi:hypothetical protein